MIHVDSVDFFMGMHSWGVLNTRGMGLLWKFWFFPHHFSCYHHPDMVNSPSVDEHQAEGLQKLKISRNYKSITIVIPLVIDIPSGIKMSETIVIPLVIVIDHLSCSMTIS